MPVFTLVQYFMPRWAAVLLAHVSGRIGYRLCTHQRRQLATNIRYVLGRSATEKAVDLQTRNAFINMTTCFLDLVRAPVLGRRLLKIIETDTNHLAWRSATSSGAILVTGHLGNWDLAAAAIPLLGCRLDAVVEPIPGAWTRTYRRYRCLTGTRAIPYTDAVSIRRSAASGRLLALLADRVFEGKGISCAAFDARRSYPRGPAVLSRRFDLPVLVAHMTLQHTSGRPPYRLAIGTPILPAAAKSIEHMTETVVKQLNQAIRTHPDQWFVFDEGWN